MHRHILDQEQYLEALSASLQKRQARTPGFVGMPEQRLIEQLHMSEQRALRQARMITLDQEQLRLFTQQVSKPRDMRITWPSQSMWITIEEALPNYSHPRCAVLPVVCGLGISSRFKPIK